MPSNRAKVLRFSWICSRGNDHATANCATGDPLNISEYSILADNTHFVGQSGFFVLEKKNLEHR